VPLTQILNPLVPNEFLEVQKPILRRKFPEAKRKSKRGRPESDISGFSQEFVSLPNWRIFLGGICHPSSPVTLFWWMKDLCREFQATPHSTESGTEYQFRT